MPTAPIITDLVARVKRLMEEHRRLNRHCDALTAERDALRADKRALQEQIKAMDRELTTLRLGQSFASGDDKKKARARVNRLMREVDKCIALLKGTQ